MARTVDFSGSIISNDNNYEQGFMFTSFNQLHIGRVDIRHRGRDRYGPLGQAIINHPNASGSSEPIGTVGQVCLFMALGCAHLEYGAPWPAAMELVCEQI